MDQAHCGPSHDHELWESVVQDARGRVQRRQARTIERYGLSGDVQYFYSLDDGTITWSRGGREFLRGRITMIASVNTGLGTWLWAWANESLPHAVLGDVDRIHRYGVEHSFPLLVWPDFRADEKPVGQARIVAADLLEADLLWRSRSGDLEVHLAVHDLRRS